MFSKDWIYTNTLYFAVIVALCSIFQASPVQGGSINTPQFYFNNSNICMLESVDLVIANPSYANKPWDFEYYNPFEGRNVVVPVSANSNQSIITIKPTKTGTFTFRLITIDGFDIFEPPVAKLTVSKSATIGDIKMEENEDDPYTVKYSINVSKHCSRTELEYSWKFSDGETSSSASPEHTYSFGVSSFDATLKLTAQNNGMSETFTAESAFGIPPMVAKEFTLSAKQACNMEIIKINAVDMQKGANEKWSYEYSIDAGMKYSVECTKRTSEEAIGTLSAGDHIVYIYGSDGQLEAELSVAILPAYSQSPGLAAVNTEDGTKFTLDMDEHAIDGKACHGAFEYIWDFGDGTTEEGTENTAVHSYAQTGLYQIKATISSQNDKVYLHAIVSLDSLDEGDEPEITILTPAADILALPSGFPVQPPESILGPVSAIGHAAVINIAILAASLLLLAVTILMRMKSHNPTKAFEMSLVEFLIFVLLAGMSLSTSDFTSSFVAYNSYTAIYALGFIVQVAACWFSFSSMQSSASS
ncbi:MAG: PKD domain-containing protein [Eubacteriaceae bacterium]|nr:PKD domain-containing protein [Eubacteriaceae bacterium]